MSNRAIGTKIKRNALALICLAILCAILTAGLWPFNPFPKNEVSWLEGEDGLRFGDYGSIFSSGTFKTTGSQNEAPCSLEIWIEPGSTYDQNSLVTFYASQNPAQFRLRQSGDDLFVLREDRDAREFIKTAEIRAGHAFRKGRKLLITITSGTQGTSLYLDAHLVQVSSHFGLTSRDLTGQLIVGGAPLDNDSWSGVWRGLAIYHQDLTLPQVVRHFDMWAKAGPFGTSESERAVAVYKFNERTGRVVRNQINSEPDLYIPEHFEVPRQLLLVRPWDEFQPNWSYCKNLIINVVGFVPLGFFFCAYFSSSGRITRPVLATVIFGGAVSLTIEILQAYIPTRSSGMTDVITNTIGTAIGSALFGWKTVHEMLSKIGIPIGH